MKNKYLTQLLHTAKEKKGYQGIHPSIENSVTFHYAKTQDLVDAFQSKKEGFTYSRGGSPTVQELEKKINLLENGEESLCFATGMAAISTTCLAFLKKGNHVLASRYLFGNTYNFFYTLNRLGIEVEFVDVTDINEVIKKVKKNTKLFFAETIANPNTQIPDWENLTSFFKQKKIVTIIDNTLTSPYLFQPKELGFSLSLNSLSKYIAGHGAVLGGSITDLGNYDWTNEENILPLYKKNSAKSFITHIKKRGIRDMGSTLSPYSAFLILLGMETLFLRMERQGQNALQVAQFLNEHSQVEYVNYPGLTVHKQNSLAKKYYHHFGAILAFKVKGDPIYFCNQLKVILRSSHLGDNRTLAIPVAQTIFHEISQAEKKKMGIDENLIRLSVGIESCSDLILDLNDSLKKLAN